MSNERDPVVGGIEPREPDHKDVERHRELRDAQHGRKTLLDIGKVALARYVKRRWDRLEKAQRLRLAELKVNWLRYKGESFVQVHPSNPNEVFFPPGSRGRRAPTINKIKRTVHRYVAQVTADDPIIEGMPASHRDEDRDAAEAATAALRGEWQRMHLSTKLRRTMNFAAVMRSAFWFIQWDPRAGGKQKAQKFFRTDRGDRVLMYVDKDGNKVEDPSKAATIMAGDIRVDVLTPANVRWSNGIYAHEADEVMVGEMLRLRELYDAYPKTREVKLSALGVGGYEQPLNSTEWLEDIRGETPMGMRREFSDEELSRIGNDIPEDDNLLDEQLLVIHYYRKSDRTHPMGLQCAAAGDWQLYKPRPLRYGKFQLVHFKLLDEMDDPLGLGLVDLLKDPQELLDFVNGQILRYLQMLKRRWFVPLHSGVKARDLMSPTRSIIEYNPQAGPPVPEVQPEIPNSMVTFVERFDTEFDDQAGIHDTLQGKHVPGVSSGRHAEALRSGDETLLGLTRDQMKMSLETASEVMLAIMQKEWKQERRVRFLGDDREYVDVAFKSTDFGQTGKCVLKNSTLLMLTPAQRMETIMALAEAGALGADEVRQLAPLGDVMGISLAEDVHYQRARRQSARFLLGPPKALKAARKRYDEALEDLEKQRALIDARAMAGPIDDTALAVATQNIEDGLAMAELEWTETLDKYAFDHRKWEDKKDIAAIHAAVHAEALAQAKVDRFDEWWVQLFEDHAVLEYELGFPELVMEAAQVQAATQPQPQEPLDTSGVETAPAGVSFNDQTPDVVTGGATGAP
jgi:hypothetical protein